MLTITTQLRKYSAYDGDLMMWAACCLCYFGFLRAREIKVPSVTADDEGQHPSIVDVAVDSIVHPRTLKARIKASKTDPFRKGADIFLD